MGAPTIKPGVSTSSVYVERPIGRPDSKQNRPVAAMHAQKWKNAGAEDDRFSRFELEYVRTNPVEAWMLQQAGNLQIDLERACDAHP